MSKAEIIINSSNILTHSGLSNLHTEVKVLQALEIPHGRHGEGLEDVPSQVEGLEVPLQPEEGVLREGEEAVVRQAQLGDAGPVEGVGVELADVVSSQIQGLEAGDLVDPPRDVGELALLEGEADQGVLHPGEQVLVHVLDVAPDHGEVGEGDVVEEPGGEVSEAGGEVVEAEGGDVVLDGIPDPHYPRLVRPVAEDVEAGVVLLAGAARHLVTGGAGRPHRLHLEPRHLRPHGGDGGGEDEQEREGRGSHGTCLGLKTIVLRLSLLQSPGRGGLTGNNQAVTDIALGDIFHVEFL